MQNLPALEKLFVEIDQCKDCHELEKHIKFPVYCHGNRTSGIMLVSEGAYLPSIQAGRYFERGFLRSAIPDLEAHCYLTDVIKCDSCKKKTTTLADRCMHFLVDEISAIQPKAILAVGSMPFEKLCGKFYGSFIELHGQRRKFHYKDIEVIPLIHPSRANIYYPIEPRVANYKESLQRIIYGFAS